MKAMIFRDDITLIPIDIFKDHNLLVFDLTSVQDITEKCHSPELVGETLRLELFFTFPLEHVNKLIVMGNECLWLQLTNLVLPERRSKKDNVSLQQITICIPLLMYRYLGSLPSEYVPTFDNDTFAFINTQPNNMQGEHWAMSAKFRHEI